MKKRTKLFVAVGTAVAVGLAVTVFAANYDSSSDPLVALSYLTDVFRPSVDKDIKAVSDRVTEAEAKISSIEEKISSGGGSSESLDGEIAEIKTMLQEINGELADISSNSASKGDVSTLSESISSLDSRISALTVLIERLNSQNGGGEYYYGFELLSAENGSILNLCDGGDVLLKSGGARLCDTSGAFDTVDKTEYLPSEELKTGHIVNVPSDGRIEITEDTTYIMIRGEYRFDE